MKTRTWLGLALVGISALVGCGASSSDDASSDEAAASVFDPRVRQYVFDMHAAKLPECSTPKCTIQLRLRAYGRVGRVVDDACYVYDFSGNDPIEADGVKAFYKPLETTDGDRVGGYATNSQSDVLSGDTNAGFLGDVNTLEFSVEEGPTGAFSNLDKKTGCFANGTVRHKAKTAFDEDKDAHRNDHLLDLVFGSRVDYVYGQSALRFTPIDCDGKWGFNPECPSIAQSSSADGGTEAGASKSDAGAADGSASTADGGTSNSTPGVSAPPQPAPASDDPSAGSGSDTSSSDDPSGDGTDPSTGSSSKGSTKKASSKDSSGGGCSQSGGTGGAGGAGGALLVTALVLASERRRRRNSA